MQYQWEYNANIRYFRDITFSTFVIIYNSLGTSMELHKNQGHVREQTWYILSRLCCIVSYSLRHRKRFQGMQTDYLHCQLMRVE